MTDLKGQTALITGGARRIGRGIALRLAEDGAAVAIHYQSSKADALELVETIAGKGGRAWAIQADLEDTVSAEGLIARTAELAGPVDILENNASIFPSGRLDAVTADDINLNMQVNAVAPLQISRGFAGQVQGEGHIINLLDCRIVDCDAAHVAYHLSKRALFSLTRMMALEFAPAIKVNAVAPGLILPPAG